MFRLIFLSLCFIFNVPFCSADDPRIQEVLTYWFGDLKTPEDYPNDKRKIWFNGGMEVDQEIRHRFGDLVMKAADHKLDDWKTTPRGRLALIILVDQFPRNIFRGTPEAFAFDSTAQELTLEGLNLGHDQALFPIERVFFYLPLEHAEIVKIQELSVAKFNQLASEAPITLKANFESSADYAVRHYVIIEKFGRFPHRNAILERDSTLEEIEFLKGPNSSF
jgi:uncharacterized protein (DUF924 family)